MNTPPILGREIARYLRRELGASALNEHYEDVLGFIEDGGSLAARVVEGVLAGSVVRRMLANHGLHSGDTAPKRRPGT